ncbi:Mitoguardin 2 [Bagarius yarrelli]|uniref:Mitoguardin 2 n=1 Tax=Bagarius yarrelli TaxID=175774 RepID=A0A556TU78_BAGYA|nr:Mitoguardin 2 [Bagarius yarrelli]
MSIRQSEGVSIMQALAMTVAEIPVFLYSTFGQSIFSQLRLTPSLKKVLFATALGSVALALTAHHLKRRSRKRKQITEKPPPKTVGIPDQLLRSARPTSLKRAAVATPWEAETVAEEPGGIEDANAENLYLMGMGLFEEALQKWEQALNIRHQTQSNSSSTNSLARQGAALTPETRNRKFAEKLESLLHRAYHLQEAFGSTVPADSLLADLVNSGFVCWFCTTAQVVCMNFFDIVLDFILMDAFEDLENPPTSVVAVLRNRWLSDSFKETALATACWSVLKAKRRLLMVPDGFISHFYSISEHVSPVLAFGFLGPRQHLSEVCTIFKQQIVQYLKDMFDHDKVRFTSTQSLAEDILSLSHRRTDILLGYLGINSLPDANGELPASTDAQDS